jgi:hypothetical protein
MFHASVNLASAEAVLEDAVLPALFNGQLDRAVMVWVALGYPEAGAWFDHDMQDLLGYLGGDEVLDTTTFLYSLKVEPEACATVGLPPSAKRIDVFRVVAERAAPWRRVREFIARQAARDLDVDLALFSAFREALKGTIREAQERAAHTEVEEAAA